jgi:hypothetical protein
MGERMNGRAAKKDKPKMKPTTPPGDGADHGVIAAR